MCVSHVIYCPPSIGLHTRTAYQIETPVSVLFVDFPVRITHILAIAYVCLSKQMHCTMP